MVLLQQIFHLANDIIDWGQPSTGQRVEINHYPYKETLIYMASNNLRSRSARQPALFLQLMKPVLRESLLFFTKSAEYCRYQVDLNFC